MADLETRVTAPEREVDALKERQTAVDADLQNLPELIKLEHKFTNTRIDRLSRDVGDLKIDVDGLKVAVERLPRVMAEIIHEKLNEKSSKGGL